VRALSDRIAGAKALILIGADGRIGAHFNSQRMTHAFWNSQDSEDHIIA
jgi:beta-aspartyl-peptidase (threonine type)